MSVDQKQNVMIKNAEEERALLEKTIQESKEEKKVESSSSEETSSDSETGFCFTHMSKLFKIILFWVGTVGRQAEQVTEDPRHEISQSSLANFWIKLLK